MKKNRQVRILQKLMNDSCCTINQLSLLCDASYKTVQGDIKEINQQLKRMHLNTMISTQRGIGVALEHASASDLTAILQYYESRGEVDQAYDKAYYALQIAFACLQTTYLKIDDISNELLLSRSVVQEILNESKQYLKRWNITIQARPHYGLYAVGQESDIRRFLFENLVLKNDNQIQEFMNVDRMAFFTLREGVLATIRNFDVSISDENLEQLLLYVEIMTIRLMKHKGIEHESCLENASFEYILSEKIMLQVDAFLGSPGEEAEVNWIYRFIIGKCLRKTENYSYDNHKLIDELLPRAIALIADKYGYDFSHDLDFYTSMSIHLSSLLKRAKMNSYLINPMLDSIKTYSLLAYDMATDISLLLNERLNQLLPDDEISYFAIHLHLAIERQKQKIVPRNALVICPSGKGMSEMVAHHVRKQYGEYIAELRTCGYFDLDQIDYAQYDYIFTMKPLHVEVPLPVIEFSLNSNKHTIQKTKLQILGKQQADFPLARLMSPSLFISHIDADTKEDTLRQIIDQVGKTISLSPDFYESVIRREKIVSTDLDHGFAIPHPLDKEMAERSFFSLTVLNNAVLWDKRKVRIVLLSYIKGDMEELDMFYEIFAQLVTSKEYEIALLDKPTYEHFVEIVKEIQEAIRSY